MVVGEPLDVVIEGEDAGRGDDPSLPHGAAELMLEPPPLRHQLGRPRDERPERAPEALREADRHRVELPGDIRRGDAARNRGVEYTRAVEVHRELQLAARRNQGPDLFEWPHAPAGAVVCVLDRNHPGRGDVRPVGAPNHPLHDVRPEAAGLAAHRPRHQTGMNGRTAEFGEEDVRILLGDQLVARL